MARLIVRRRRDGVIQLRRRRAWELVSLRALAAVLILSSASVAVSLSLAAALVRTPLLLAAVIPAALLAVWLAHGSGGRQPLPATRPTHDPPRPPRQAA